ncbi:hypothetical protein [Nocardia testacea]|uniref:hypothetical protein n=1 Tax=Nocardia testacea TaxID=248551 RepID=UPI0002DAED04|nr:hypothetical protein [Nocardia testacea]
MPTTVDPYVVEEDITFAEMSARRRSGTRAEKITVEESNLVGDYFWLAEDGLAFETIARRLHRSPDALAQTLHRTGLHHRTPDRAAVDKALALLVARGAGHRFTTDDLPPVDLATISHALKTAKSAGHIRRGGSGEWVVITPKENPDVSA